MTNKFIITIFLIVAAVIIGGGLLLSLGSKEQVESHNHKEELPIYTCPMHPEIRQNEPGNCPICHMKLVKVTNGSAKAPESTQTSINVSPYQADLIGIAPTTVKKENVEYKIPVSGRILSSSNLAFQIYQSDLKYIKPGAKFNGQGEIYPEDFISGEVLSVDHIADPSSRTVRVVGRIQGNPRGLFPEANFTGQVIVDLNEKLVVPESAVLFTGRGSFVYLYKGEKLTPKKVVLGPKVNDQYVINEGLSAGDVISSGPNFLIDSEAKIRGLNDQSHH